MSDNEKDIQDLINKFNHQQQGLTQHNTQPQMPQTPSFDNQGLNDLPSTPINPQILQPGPAPTPAPIGNVCPQCGMVHPPLRQNEKCPNVASKVKDEKTDSIIDVNKYLNTFQTIIISQIEKQKIKDVQKLYSNITVELTKFLEGYKE